MDSSELLQSFKNVQTFIFDVDGVLTDGSVLITEKGELLRKMNVKDGYAIKRALEQGYRVGIITGGGSQGVVERLKGLGVVDIFSKVQHKEEAFDDYQLTFEFDPATVLYMGDDMPDYNVMKLVGLPVCPADAIPEIKMISKYVSYFNGGQGCVREVIEKVLKLNKHW